MEIKVQKAGFFPRNRHLKSFDDSDDSDDNDDNDDNDDSDDNDDLKSNLIKTVWRNFVKQHQKPIYVFFICLWYLDYEKTPLLSFYYTNKKSNPKK